jgi:hypothetical protein
MILNRLTVKLKPVGETPRLRWIRWEDMIIRVSGATATGPNASFVDQKEFWDRIDLDMLLDLKVRGFSG